MRTAPHAARSYLHARGYCTIPFTTTKSPFDFIAWKGRDELIFIRAFSSRGMKPKNRYHAHLAAIRSFVSTILYPGRAEFWIEGEAKWNRYTVMPGGFIHLSGGI